MAAEITGTLWSTKDVVALLPATSATFRLAASAAAVSASARVSPKAL